MIEIIPAIMPQSVRDLEDKLSRIAKYVDTVQIDVMDGKFVKARSWPYIGDRGDFEAILSEEQGMPLWDKVDFEAHLMISHPEDAADSWINMGAKRIVVHVESTKKIPDIIAMINARFPMQSKDNPEVALGLALKLETPTDEILPYLEDIHFVQFMGISSIGVQAAPLDERTIPKMQLFHNAHPEVIISIDGGVTVDNAAILREAGAKRLVAGSAIFQSGNPEAAIRKFKAI